MGADDRAPESPEHTGNTENTENTGNTENTESTENRSAGHDGPNHEQEIKQASARPADSGADVSPSGRR